MRNPQTVPAAPFPFFFYPFFSWVRSPQCSSFFFSFFFSFLFLGSISPVLPFFFFFLLLGSISLVFFPFFSSSSSFTGFGDLGFFFFFFPFFFHWVQVIWTFFFPFLLSLVLWSGFVKSWSNSGGYGSDRFDSAAAMVGLFPRYPSYDNSNSNNWSSPTFRSLKTLKPTIATTIATATSTSMAWADLSLLLFFLFLWLRNLGLFWNIFMHV